MAAGHAAAAFHKHCIKLQRIGKPQSAIARIERGQRRVDVIEFVQLAMVIGFDPVRVLSRIIREHGATRQRIVLSKKHGG